MENIYSDVIYEYQQTLLGRYANISSAYFQRKNIENGKRNEKIAIEILRYAIEDILHWTPTQALERLNASVLRRLSLLRIVEMIEFPPETDRQTDFFVYVHKVYPQQIKLDMQALTISMLNKVINREVQKFPKGFFYDKFGKTRAEYSLNYLLAKNATFNSKEDMYEKFASPHGRAFITKYRLELARRTHWDSPLDFLHDSLSSEDRDDVWYHFFKIKKLIRGDRDE